MKRTPAAGPRGIPVKSRVQLSFVIALVAAAACWSGCGESSTAAPGSQHIQTVFLILMENKDWANVKGSPSAPFITNTLLPASSYAENYRGAKAGTLHPSEPNYIWLEAGDSLGITNDGDPAQNHRPQTDHLVTLLEDQGISWRSYQEDISGLDCPLSGVGKYAPKHNQMVFFDDVINYDPQTMAADPLAPRCIAHVRPLGELVTDLQQNTAARYNYITPNLCNDMHDTCDPQHDQIKQGDDWLARWIPIIQQSTAYQRGGVIFITWDESGSFLCGGDCPTIGMIVLSPLAKGGGYSNTIPYDHSSTLKTLQEIFHVAPLLRHAADAGVNDLGDLFTSFP
jgi:hypothetical protein